jgi:CysZ protein
MSSTRLNAGRRALAGAFWLPRGVLFLIFHPSLLPLVVLPALVAGVLLVAALLIGFWMAPLVEARLAPPEPRWLSLLSGFIITLATLSAGAALALGLALLLVSPILDRLSRRVERIVRGAADDRGSGLAWEVKESLRGALYFLAAAPGIFLLAFIPIVGPLLAILWAGFALSFQFSDPPLTRRGLGFGEKRAWHRRHRPEALGFGIAGLFAFLIPLADLLVAPALAAGATLLVLDLEERGERSPQPRAAGVGSPPH